MHSALHVYSLKSVAGSWSPSYCRTIVGSSAKADECDVHKTYSSSGGGGGGMSGGGGGWLLLENDSLNRLNNTDARSEVQSGGACWLVGS